MTEYTMDHIEWRDNEIADTVRFLEKVNPKGYDAASIKRHAFIEWRKGDYRPTFVGTAGWYVTIIPKSYASEKPFIALVSLMAFTAVKAI